MIEFLISLSLVLIITLAAFEFFGQTRTLFFKIKDAVEDSQAAHSALDKLRIDLIRGGRGLTRPLALGFLDAVRTGPESLTILSAQTACRLRQDVEQGESRIALESSTGLKKGTEICVFDRNKGEVGRVAEIEGDILILGSPLANSYLKAKTKVIGLETISFFLDAGNRTLRRKVNSSPAQPLLEDVATFEPSYDKSRNLAGIIFTLADHKEKRYEFDLFPKNLRLAFQR